MPPPSPASIRVPQLRQDSTPFKGSSSQTAPQPGEHPGVCRDTSWGPSVGGAHGGCVLGSQSGGAHGECVLGPIGGAVPMEGASWGPRADVHMESVSQVPGPGAWRVYVLGSHMGPWRLHTVDLHRVSSKGVGRPFCGPSLPGEHPSPGGRHPDGMTESPHPPPGLTPNTHPGTGQGAEHSSPWLSGQPPEQSRDTALANHPPPQ